MLGFARTGKYSRVDVAFKFDQMYKRIQIAAAKELARPMWRSRRKRACEADPAKSVRPISAARNRSDEAAHAYACARRRRTSACRRNRSSRGREEGQGFPPVVIDLKRVADLRADVVEVDGRFRIGARAVMTDVIRTPVLRELFPALVEAALVVGSVQIRNRATVAGNLCNASPAADTAPALLAYGASLNLVSAGGSRQMPLEDFFSGPGRTVLSPGELVASIDLPLPTERTGGAFGRLTRRHGVDLAIVNLCCVVRASGDVRFAFGAVGPRPFVVDIATRCPTRRCDEACEPHFGFAGGRRLSSGHVAGPGASRNERRRRAHARGWPERA